ncbi:hypothetical protein Hanom_Chr13g01224501 [Helianthus anomalus]
MCILTYTNTIQQCTNIIKNNSKNRKHILCTTSSKSTTFFKVQNLHNTIFHKHSIPP